MEFNKKLRTAREMAGISRSDLAMRIGVSLATINRWEYGETEPSVSQIVELANVLEKEILYFFTS